MRLFIPIFFSVLLPSIASAYLVAPAMPLEKMVQEADVILKATVVSTAKTTDDSFKAHPHWAVFATRMRVVTVLKGQLPADQVDFHHYDEDRTSAQPYMFAPQHYHFEPGKSYIIFAKFTDKPGLLRPLWDFHRMKEDQGQLLAANDKPIVPNTSVNDAIWNELAGLLHSDQPALVRYAVGQLQSMSNAPDVPGGLDDFPRQKVLDAIASLLDHKDPQIVAAVVEAVGYRSPYRRNDNHMGWLATVGKGTLLARGHGKYPDNWDNPDARKYQAALVHIADTNASADLRARAIRALGLCGDKPLLDPLRRWCVDSAPEVRAAAALLWADFPGPEAQRELIRMSGDAEPSVRLEVAAAIGFLQSPELLIVLDGLLRDKDPSVRTMAAMSAISFDPKDSGTILKAFRDKPEFHANFVNALALRDPKPYLDELAQIVAKNDEPKLYFVAQMPVYTSWQILKSDMETRSPDELAAGQLDKCLDALDQPPNIGSGPYQEMYRFYLEKSMKNRAARFRENARKRVTGYDIDYYFKLVDQTPQR